MKKEYMIKKNYDISYIIKKKNSVANKYFVMYKLQNKQTEHFRIAVSVSKKIGNAVVRNRLKRQIKSVIYNNRFHINKNYDILIIARKGIEDLEFSKLQESLINCLKKAKLYD
ncbi:ribonuclease P protein component [Haloplasma contractile]|uniref:Ribonuclease P protein component n=1 Tax=Haloplasma contractile SSD-17B TaxID=1033810 RepID=F7PT45_9MOLU|nr:ribonuclease P protein component [Haloplasma contractile]ERJ12540.1 Ribonuclease P protein component [Haloplasma contractile SSD-17B]